MLFEILTDNFNGTVITAHGASLIIGFVLAAAIFLSLYRVDSQIKLSRPIQNLIFRRSDLARWYSSSVTSFF